MHLDDAMRYTLDVGRAMCLKARSDRRGWREALFPYILAPYHQAI